MQTTDAKTLQATQQWLNYAYSGDVLVNLGQFSKHTEAALKRAVKAGHLKAWRGKWFPQAGAPVGIGPDKTCYALPAIAQHFAEFRRGVEAHP
jgi:hypothetical protein